MNNCNNLSFALTLDILQLHWKALQYKATISHLQRLTNKHIRTLKKNTKTNTLKRTEESNNRKTYRRLLFISSFVTRINMAPATYTDQAKLSDTDQRKLSDTDQAKLSNCFFQFQSLLCERFANALLKQNDSTFMLPVQMICNSVIQRF